MYSLKEGKMTLQELGILLTEAGWHLNDTGSDLGFCLGRAQIGSCDGKTYLNVYSYNPISAYEGHHDLNLADDEYLWSMVLALTEEGVAEEDKERLARSMRYRAAKEKGQCLRCEGTGYTGPFGDCCSLCEGSGWPID